MVDTAGSGDISVNALSRVLLTSGLSASVIDHVCASFVTLLIRMLMPVNLLDCEFGQFSSKGVEARVLCCSCACSLSSKWQRCVKNIYQLFMLLTRHHKELSIEHVASLAAQNKLPDPSLDLDAIAPTMSTMTTPSTFRRDSIGRPSAGGMVTQPSYSQDDPWQAGRNQELNGASDSIINGAPSSVSGTGMPRDWWKRQERAQVKLLGLQGFILNRYMVYEISSDVSYLVYNILSLIHFVAAWRICFEEVLRIRFPLGLPRPSLSFPYSTTVAA